MQLDTRKWVLPLSGGFDSRCILASLKNTDGLRAITWGLRSSLSDTQNDAYVAWVLARLFKLQHQYYVTDFSNEPLQNILNRFLVCGEGRIDHISGYMDGFKIWKTLYEDGVQGILRGDEGFGWVPVSNSLDVRNRVGLLVWSDFVNLRPLSDFGLLEESLPGYLRQREAESLEGWRDRLYHEFRIPVFLAPLNDLKASYVEISNPLLSKNLIQLVRCMPDHLRTDKNLYKTIVRSISPPNVGFAKYPAIASSRDILRTKQTVSLLRDELDSHQATRALPKQLIDYILPKLKITTEPGPRIAIRSRIHRYVPSWIKNRALGVMKPKMDFNVLAFRAYVFCMMCKMFAVDANRSLNALAEE
jgi:hypothetical protein